MKKSLVSGYVPWIAVIVLPVVIAACVSPEDRDWRAANGKPSVEAYAGFLAAHPGGRFAGEAGQKLEEWEFREAATANSPGAFQSFVQRHPTGPFADRAREAIDGLDWGTAREAGSFKGWAAYLAQHADGQHAGDAKARMDTTIAGRSREFANVRTVAIAVRQDFSDDIKDVTIGFESSLADLFPYFGVEAPPAGAAGDATLTVRADATAYSASYSQFGIGSGTEYYTGASVSGNLILESPGKTRLTQTFSGEVPCPYTTSGSSPEPKDAPFDEAMRNDFPRQAAALLGRGFGYAPLADALGSGDGSVAAASIWALERGGPAARKVLAAALSSDNPQVSLRAAEALGGHHDPEAVKLLGGCLETDGDAFRPLRERAADSLAELGALAVPYLETVGKDPRPFVREAASRALGGIPTAKSVSLLAPLLDDAIPAVKQAAINALGEHKTPQAVGLLIDRLAAKDEADRGPWLESVRKSVPGEAVASDPDSEEPERTLTWTGGLAARLVQVFPLLESQPELQAKLGGMLSSIGEPAVTPLVLALKSGSVAVRRAAAAALGGMGDMTSEVRLGALRSAAGDQDKVVRMSVAKGLSGTSDMGVIEPLARLFTDPEADVRDQALTGLNQALSVSDSRAEFRRSLGQPDILKALVAVMETSAAAKTADRDAAAAVLGRIGSPAVDALLAALKSPNRLSREGAVTALGAAGDDRAVIALVAFGELPDVRTDDPMTIRLYEALGASKSRKSREFLSQGLAGDQSDGRRSAAAMALGEIGDIRAVDALAAALSPNKTALDTTIGDVIQRLTDYYPDDPETEVDWKSWWAKNRGRYLK
jgi:HEAT repeat protein